MDMIVDHPVPIQAGGEGQGRLPEEEEVQQLQDHQGGETRQDQRKVITFLQLLLTAGLFVCKVGRSTCHIFLKRAESSGGRESGMRSESDLIDIASSKSSFRLMKN